VLETSARPSAVQKIERYGTVLALLLLVALAACLRLAYLLPLERGLQAGQDYDEGVWASTAQLWLQGYLPYRDFFATLPPLGIYLLAGVLRLVYVPWGSGTGLMATRYASVLYGLLTVGAVYALGRKLSGRAVGLAAAGLLATDGMVLGMDRLAMLEPPLNLFSALAILAYLTAFERSADDIKGQRTGALAGGLAALAALAKAPGALVILTLLSISVLRRRWREAVFVAGSFGLAWLALSAYFLVQCPEDFVKQVYFFQLLRPADGVVNRLARLYQIWHYEQAWLTVRLGILGGLCIGLFTIGRRQARSWWVVMAWAGYSLLLILANSSYYPQYYVQWAIPLCLLGGGLLDARLLAIRSDGTKVKSLTLGRWMLIAVVVLGLLGGQIVSQYRAIEQAVAGVESTYLRVADYIRRHSSPDAMVLAFEPNYTFLSSRAPAGAGPGRFFVDSYGEMLYVNLGIEYRSLSDLVKGMLGDKPQLQPTFWREPAQDSVLSAFDHAAFVVIDGRARYQLSPPILARVRARTEEAFAFGVAAVRVKE
jgi:hypothetical protein